MVSGRFRFAYLWCHRSGWEGAVAIYRMLQGMAFDEETVKAMTTAYEATLVELGLTDRADPLTTIAGSKIIAHCQATKECDPERLCEVVLKDIQA
jgi:hypothetical protein